MSRSSRALPARLSRAARVFAALGDATRIAIITRLCGSGPQSITELAQESAVTRQAVTKHLDVLARAGLVRDAWRGRERIFELEPAPLGEARLCLDQISASWDQAIGRLRQLVEDDG